MTLSIIMPEDVSPIENAHDCSGERGLLARSFRQPAGNIRRREPACLLAARWLNFGKLPKWAGWQPALPRQAACVDSRLRA